MEGGALSSAAFKEFSAQVVPFLHVTSHVDGRPLDDLLMDKAERPSFPSFLFLDAAGEVVCEYAGAPDVKGFARAAQRVRHFLELKQRKAAGDAAVDIDLAITAAELWRMDVAELEEALEEKELGEADRKRVRQLQVNAEVEETLPYVRGLKDRDERLAATEDLVTLHAGGVDPDSAGTLQYWELLAEYGMEKGDARLLADAIAALRGYAGEDPRLAGRLEAMEARLKELGK